MLKSNLYVNDIAEEQGYLFETIAEKNQIDLMDFIVKYMTSDYKQRVDNQEAWFAMQLYYEQLAYFLKHFKFKKATRQYDAVLAQWVGEFLAYLQNYTQIPSRQLITKLSAQQLYNMAHGLHDLDMEMAVKKVGKTL